MKAILRKGMAACAAVLMGANVMAQSVTAKKQINDDAFLYCIDGEFTYDSETHLLDFTDESVIIYNDELEIVKDVDRNILGYLKVSCLNYDNNSSMYGMASITQTLFNNDDKYEYICGVGDVKNEYGETINTGLKVLADDGECLYEFQGNISPYEGVMVIHINGKSYLRIVEDHGDWRYTTHFLKIEKNANRIQEIRQMKGRMNITPTIADRDTQITITLNEENSNVARELVVTGVNGQLVGRRDIPAGENSVQIPASMLRSGMYNFTLQQKGQVVDNGKVIVK